MKIIADTHTHTLACSHAYSTLQENIAAAKAKGLKFIANTEHAPAIPGAPIAWNISKQHMIPDVVDGIVVLKGCEVNIMDYTGKLDLTEKVLGRLDWVIASYHTVCCPPATVPEHTAGWLAVAQNPLVDVIGHCGDDRYAFDHERVIRAFAQNGKIVEINSHSFHARAGSAENCRQIALLCKQYRVPVVVSSDAHFSTMVGQVEASVAMLEEIDFPQELILNADYDRFLQLARQKSGRQLIAD